MGTTVEKKSLADIELELAKELLQSGTLLGQHSLESVPSSPRWAEVLDAYCEREGFIVDADRNYRGLAASANSQGVTVTVMVTNALVADVFDILNDAMHEDGLGGIFKGTLLGEVLARSSK